MPTREAMRSLGEDIISSFDLRINGVEVIKETVRTDLRELKNSREAMAEKLHADLAQHTADMKEAVASELKGFDVELGEVRTTLDRGQDEWRKLVSTMDAKRSGATVAKPPKAAKTTEFTAETTPDFAGLPQAGGKRHHSSKKVKAGKGKSH